MRFEWDKTKRRTNISKHGVDFTHVEAFQWEAARIWTYLRKGEQRFTAYGYIGNHLHVLVYTERESILRVISLRRATKKDRRRYAAT